MFRLYRSLVHSKLDYGSVVYGSTYSSYLKMLDPVHNRGLRPCLSAFRTSTTDIPHTYNEPSLYYSHLKLSVTMLYLYYVQPFLSCI